MKRRLFRENLGLKLLALLIAITLRYYFYSPDNSRTLALSGDIYFRGVPQSLMFISPRNAELGIPARIEVRGPAPLVEQLRQTNLRFFVDYPQDSLEDAPLKFTGKVDVSQLWLPTGVEVVDLSPATVNVQLERKVEKDVKVLVKRSGELKSGYRLDRINVRPETVKVTGPETEAAALTSVVTQDLNLDGFSGSKSRELPLEQVGLLTTFSPSSVIVDVVTSAIPAQVSIDRVAVRVLAPEDFAAAVHPARVRVVLGGPAEVLEAIKGNDFQLTADARTLGPGKHEVELKADLNPEVSIISVDPPKVSVTLSKSR